MFGPYQITCEDCEFEEQIACGETAQTTAETHSNHHGHATRITELNTSAEVRVTK